MVSDNVKEYRGLVPRDNFCKVLNGSAPWDTEPDLVVGTYRGYAFVIARMYSGCLNGYVAVPPEHRYFGVGYMDIDDINVHGGLTYSEPTLSDLQIHCDIRMPKQLHSWWLGFDTSHGGDFAPSRNYHAWSNGTYRDYGYVYAQVLNVIRRLSRNAEDTEDVPGPGGMPEVVFESASEPVSTAALDLGKMN